MKKSISTAPTKENMSTIIEILTVIPERLQHLSVGLAAEQLRIPLAAGGRSLTEDLTHLINCEARTSESIFAALLTNEPHVLDIHPERQWGKLLRYERFEFADLLAYFRFRRAVLLGVLGSLSDAQWQRVVQEQGKQRNESVYLLARTIALHELEHINALEAKLPRQKDLTII